MTNNQQKNDTLTIRINNSDKQQFKEIVGEIGLNPTNAINMFIKTVIEEKSVTRILAGNKKGDQQTIERIAKNLDAIQKLMQGMEDSKDEVLDDDFDEIVKERVNFSRELEL